MFVQFPYQYCTGTDRYRYRSGTGYRGTPVTTGTGLYKLTD